MGQDLSKPLAITQPVRLAITPEIDGKIAEEEWDTLASDGTFTSYFQWEPENLYWAGTAPIGHDIVLSLDTKSDGWLIGDDNLEFRVSLNQGQPVLSVRRLDATEAGGPKWTNAAVINESVKLAATSSDTGWTLEAKFTPPSHEAPAVGSRLGVRVDCVPTGSDMGEPYFPRAMGFLNLQFDLGQNLPSGFSWKPEFLVRTVPVDDSFKVKFGFKRTEDVEFSQVDYRAEGYAKKLMATGSKPFPTWDKKGRIGDDYATIIARDAGVGYRVLRLTLTGKDNQSTVLRSSFKIADLIEYEVKLPKTLPLDPDARIIRGSVNLRSNGLKRISGTFHFGAPEAWTATRGKETSFVIYHSRGVAKVPIELIVPKDTVGVFPLTFTSKVGDKTITKTIYVPVGQS